MPDPVDDPSTIAPGETLTLPEADGSGPRTRLRPAVHLDHCVIHVTDWASANAFYGDVVGAEVIAAGRGFVYRFGGVQLNVHGPGLSSEPLAEKPVMPGGSDLCFRWSGTIESAMAHLATNGVPVERGPLERSGAAGDGISVYCRDPDGSLIEFITYPEP